MVRDARGGRVSKAVRFTLSTRQRGALAANFAARSARVQRNVRALVKDTGEAMHARAVALCPVDTGFMQAHLGLRFSPDALVFEVGWQASDFTSAGLAFYPLFQEFGFRHYITGKFIQNPCLFPARDAIVPGFKSALRAALKGAA